MLSMNKYGKLIKVGETELNAYSEGNGNVTLVFLAGSGVGCPVLEYSPIYRKMSADYRIAVVEKAGYGSSGKATTKRSVDNLVNESRAALKAAGIQPPYVLVPHSYSGFEAIWWANTFPDEVAAVLGLDMGFPNMMKAQAAQIPHSKKVVMVDKTRKLMQRIAKRGLLDKLLRNKTVNASGLLSGNALTMEEKRFYEDTYYKNIASEAVFEESILAEENAAKAEGTGYLSCPACFLVSNMRSPVKALTWQQAAKDYAEKCGAEIHLLDENHMMYTKIPDKIVGIFTDFLRSKNI